MERNWSSSLSAVLPVVVGLTGAALTANAQTNSVQTSITTVPTITSDSPEYCDVLMGRISAVTRTATTPPPTEVATLSEAGEWMCVHGQIRGGILRLRRALAIMMHAEQ